MKRTSTLLAALASAVVCCAALSDPGAGKVSGLCVETGETCNDYFFTRTPEKPDTDSIHGYEYGCGYNDRFATGVMRKDAGTWYIGFTGANHQVDYLHQQVTWNAVIDATSREGTYDVFYTYILGGEVDAHAAGGTVSLTDCDEPPIISVTEEAMTGYDSSIR